MTLTRSSARLGLAASFGLTLSLLVHAGPGLDPAEATAEMKPLAARSLMLNITDGSARAIAVGERGHILVSESRRDWRQIEGVPTRSTLTAVHARGNQAWAVGHDAVILRSADQGLSWERVWWSEGCRRVGDTSHLPPDAECEGPLMDVLFVDDQRGFAIGAYGLMLVSEDGGRSWDYFEVPGMVDEDDEDFGWGGAAEGGLREDAFDEDDEDDDWTLPTDEFDASEGIEKHLNAMALTPDGELVIVGEAGSAWRSRDGGENWERINLPYQGSLFGVIALGPGHVLAFGMRGNVFETTDLGDTWTPVDSGTELSLMGGTALPNGGAVLVGNNGVVLIRRAADQPFRKLVHPTGSTLAAVLAQTPSELVLVGEQGIMNWTAR